MATHGHGSKSTAPSDRPTVQNHSLLDTLLEGRIDKRMTAYSNKFSASGIISDPTDVDTDVLTQCIFFELLYSGLPTIQRARNSESMDALLDNIE
ncbi:hypothetical protein D6D22_08772 [Aureobasidium pullulans]|uniref:Uncharacterized protein n=1 Tax=Aureobasidium pullulans TaxID=5580 RepID=A0A4S8XAE7_AURPU|nr:hypothetical protein D6D22_08772 [Aureobasidium pullulans]